MRALVVCHLPTLIVPKLRALAAADDVDEIHVVRSTPGPPLDKVTYHALPSLVAGVPVLRVLLRLFLAVWVGWRTRCDFVVGYYLVSHGVVAIAAARVLGVPVVVSVIGTDLSKHLHGGWSVLLSRILRQADAVAVKGERAKKELMAFGIPRKKLFVLHNVLDTRCFCPRQATKRFDVIGIGRLVDVKRFDRFIAAIAAAKKRHPSLTAAIVGDGPLRATLERQARTSGMEDAIAFLGFRGDVADLLCRSRLFLLTSEKDELPFSMLEAAACGLPVVVADVGNITDIIEDGIHGVYVDAANPKDVGAAIAGLLEDEPRRTAMGGAARALAATFDVDRARKQWRQIFATLQINRAPAKYLLP